MSLQLAERTKVVQLSPIREIFEMASRTPGLVRLEVGQPDFETPEHIRKAAIAALGEGHVGYTSSAGIQETREALVARYQENYGVSFDANKEVVITTGAAAATYLAMRVLLNPGEEVLRPSPGWAQYDGCANDADAVPLTYPLLPDENFAIDFEALKARITPKTKMVIVNSPSNPTGGVLSDEQMKQLYDLAVEHDFYIVSDEAYSDIVFDKPFTPMLKVAGGDTSRVITIISASKNYAMCGWRMGCAVCSPEIAVQMTKFNSLLVLCPDYIAQKGYAAALSGTQEPTQKMCATYKERRDYFAHALNEIKGVKANIPEGAFYVFADIRELEADDVAFVKNLIQNVKVTAIPGSSFGDVGKGFVRFSYAASMENLQEGIRRMKAAFGG